MTVTAGLKDENNLTDYAVDLSDITKVSLVRADTAMQSVVTQIDALQTVVRWLGSPFGVATPRQVADLIGHPHEIRRPADILGRICLSDQVASARLHGCNQS